MREDLIALIDSTDEIEKCFHTSKGTIFGELKTIYDVQQFQDWREELRLEFQDIYDRTGDKYIEDLLNDLSKEMLGWDDVRDFSTLKGKLKAVRKNIFRYYPEYPIFQRMQSEKETERSDEREMKIFISHSSEDMGYVAKIVSLLEEMGLNQEQLFCSSLPGYNIPIDHDIFDYLRDQFLNFNLHVIFIHSDNYYSSPVCLNEMGAAWVLKNTATSILLPGFGFEKMRGVVDNRTIAIKLDDDEFDLKGKLNQLYDKIVVEFGLTKKTDIIWERKRDAFINATRHA